MSSDINPIKGKLYWIRRSIRDEHAELWKCDYDYKSESGERRYIFVNVNRITAPWVINLRRWDDLRIRGRCWAYSMSIDASMTQANPYVISACSV